MLLDTFSSLKQPLLYCNPSVVGNWWFAALRAMCTICWNSADFSIVWHDSILSYSIACRAQQRDVLWCGFRWPIPLSIEYVWNSSIDRSISTLSCSYCIWNRYCQNHRSILLNFLMIAWFDTVEFNRLPCPNNKMYDNVVFDDRFRYQLTMFEMWIYWQGYLDSFILILHMK